VQEVVPDCDRTSPITKGMLRAEVTLKYGNARCGHLDRRAQANLRNLLRSDTPTPLRGCFWPSGSLIGFNAAARFAADQNRGGWKGRLGRSCASALTVAQSRRGPTPATHQGQARGAPGKSWAGMRGLLSGDALLRYF